MNMKILSKLTSSIVFSLHGRKIMAQRIIPKPRSITTSPISNDSDLVLVDHLDAVTTIGINRPAVRNCVNTPTAEALLKAMMYKLPNEGQRSAKRVYPVEDFENDSSAKVAVLYGVGGNFCAGFDLKELSDSSRAPPASYGRGPMGPSRLETTKPIIAAVEGFAVAGGFELALWCDLRVMEDTAVMGVFCRRFGVPLIDGGTVRLQAIVGLGRALDLILTGRPIKGQEAFEWGLANRLVPCGAAVGQAVNLAKSLTKYPQECLKADRKSTYNAAFSSGSLQEALKYEHENGVPVIVKESVAGAQQFVSGVGKHGKFNITPGFSDPKSKL